MSTKFVSKNSNYMLVLRPGVEGNRALGTHAVSGLYVKFIAGVADIKEESIVAQLRAHPSFGTDFVEVKQDEVDPYSDTREEVEPPHTMSEIHYGHVEGKTKTPSKTKLTPAMKKLIESEAVKMIPGILKSNPQILKGILENLASEAKKEEVQEAPKNIESKKDLKTAPKPIEAE